MGVHLHRNPRVLRRNGEWIVYYDKYRVNRFDALKTRDWKNWVDVTDQLEFPAGARHGTVFSVSSGVLAELRRELRRKMQVKANDREN